MADNYLERRMDDYRSGKLSAPRRRAMPPVQPGGSFEALEGSRFFILTPSASSSPKAEALIRLLVSAGCKVAFTDTDTHGGNRLAQATGSQCHPIDISDENSVAASVALIKRRWGDIDCTIRF